MTNTNARNKDGKYLFENAASRALVPQRRAEITNTNHYDRQKENNDKYKKRQIQIQKENKDKYKTQG